MPVKLIGIGEALEDLRPFDPDDFAAGDPGAEVVTGRHAGRPRGAARPRGEPLLPGPTFAAPFHLLGRPADADYVIRPLRQPAPGAGCEAALGELEGGEAVVFASGMAAAVLLAALSAVPRCCAPTDACRTDASHERQPRDRSTAGRPDARSRARVRLARDALEPRRSRSAT